MKPPLPLLLTLLGLAIIAILVGVVAHGHRQGSRVFTVDELTTLLARDPGAWLGRTVLVRGVAQACQGSGSSASALYCRRLPQDLRDPGLGGASERLPLVWGTQGSTLAFLRRVPLLGGLAPAPQVIQWDALATYRVKLRATAGESCGAATCYEALLDIAP
jgi:hypothetical protein